MSIAAKLSAGFFAALGTLAIAIGLMLTLSSRPATTDDMLSLGERFLLELQFEQALVQFLGVIDIEPNNVQAIIGAAEAYVGLGQRAVAANVLRQGYERTGDERIRYRLAELEGIADFPGHDSVEAHSPDSWQAAQFHEAAIIELSAAKRQSLEAFFNNFVRTPVLAYYDEFFDANDLSEAHRIALEFAVLYGILQDFRGGGINSHRLREGIDAGWVDQNDSPFACWFDYWNQAHDIEFIHSVEFVSVSHVDSLLYEFFGFENVYHHTIYLDWTFDDGSPMPAAMLHDGRYYSMLANGHFYVITHILEAVDHGNQTMSFVLERELIDLAGYSVIEGYALATIEIADHSYRLLYWRLADSREALGVSR